MPRGVRKQRIETPEETVGQDHPRIMKSTGPAKDSLEPALVEAVDRPVDQEKLDMLKFMEEPLEIYIHPTTDPQADQIFEVFNGGERELFRRGETKTVRRKFVEVMARAKLTTFRQKEIIDGEGVRQYQTIPNTGLRYDFSVRRDDHPRGADWLKSVLAQS